MIPWYIIFYVKTKMLVYFQICISVHLNKKKQGITKHLQIYVLKSTQSRFSVQKNFLFDNVLSGKCEQFRWKLWICSYLLEKSRTKNFIFCAVYTPAKTDSGRVNVSL